jgi:hypothetical protein
MQDIFEQQVAVLFDVPIERTAWGYSNTELDNHWLTFQDGWAAAVVVGEARSRCSCGRVAVAPGGDGCD